MRINSGYARSCSISLSFSEGTRSQLRSYIFSPTTYTVYPHCEAVFESDRRERFFGKKIFSPRGTIKSSVFCKADGQLLVERND